jgi:hypothetical protein
MRTLNNLIIFALIGLLSSTYLINLSPIDYKGSIEIETPKESSTLSLSFDESQDLMNPETITLSHVSLNEEVIKIVAKNVFTAYVYENNNLVLDNLTDLEMGSPKPEDTISIGKDTPLEMKIDISQKKLGLKDGTYKIVLQSNLIKDRNKSEISLDVTYDSTGDYYPAMNTSPEGKKGLTLYFTTENADALIPVTRFVVENKSLTRMAVEELQNGPLDSRMKTLAGDVTNITYNNGNIVIDLPSSYTAYDNGSTGGLLSYNTFVKTIFAVNRYWPIHNITFTVDRKPVETYFHGIDNVSKVVGSQNYLIYLAYKVGGRYYLFDEHVSNTQAEKINDNDTIEVKAQKMFNAYSNNGLMYGRNPVPDNIKLQGVKLDGRILALDFSNEFLNAYGSKDNLKMMMIESLIYSFKTIPNVDGLKITVGGKPLKEFVKDKDLSGVLYPPKFINPEVTQ